MNVNLTWTAGANILSQRVEYKEAKLSNWNQYGSAVAASATSQVLEGLANNIFTNFRVVSVCDSGIESNASASQTLIFQTCPTVNVSKTHNSISYSFPELGGDVTGYTVKLYNAAGTQELASQTPTGTTTRTGTFSSGISASTTYQIRVIPTATVNSLGLTSTKNDCPLVQVITDDPPACNPPTNVSAAIA